MMPRRRRRNKRRYRLNPQAVPTILLALMMVVMVVIVVNLVKPDGGSVAEQDTATQSPTQVLDVDIVSTEAPAATEAPTPAPTQQTATQAHIRVFGDVMVHDDELNSALQEDGTYNFDSFFSMLTESLSDADYTMGNLETTVGEPGRDGYTGYPYFHTPKTLLNAFKIAGVDMFTTSNNHCLDRYFDGLCETLDCLDEYGFDHTGTFRSKEEYQTPYIKEINGIKIGVVAYTLGANNFEYRSDPEGVKWGLMFIYNANFAQDAQELRDAGAEVLIAVPHWGTEYKRKPDDSTVGYAQQMAQAGFDIIIGGHPHMVQNIEWIETTQSDGSTHKTLCAYSLGNFVSAQRDQYRDTGIIFDFTLSKDLSSGEVTINDIGYVPVWVWRYENGSKNEYRVVACGETLDNIPDNMSSSDQKRLQEAWDETVEVITTEGITALKK